MSQREVGRAGVIAEVAAGRMRQARTAELLKVSCRQVKRLVRAWRACGAEGLRSRRRGRPSHRCDREALREQVLALHAEHYTDFGPTLLAEHLRRRHGLALGVETLRQWLIQAGRWKVKSGRRRVHRARSRRPRFGELIQIDGSPHDWFEGRAPRCTMIVFIDDATSRVIHARLVPAETTEAYFEGLAEHLLACGRPLAYYSDRHSIFRINHPTAEEGSRTQVQRALDTLGIELICAHSPQAKGRVERVHQTFQDRFTKALRLDGANDIEAGNALLRADILEHNERFAKPPIDPEDAHRPETLTEAALRRILSPHHLRKVDHTGAIRFEQHALHVAASHRRRTMGKRLTVIAATTGIELWHEQTPIPFTPFDLTTWRTRIADRKALDAVLDQRTAPKDGHSVPPAQNHPWCKAPIGKARLLTPKLKGTSLSGGNWGHL